MVEANAIRELVGALSPDEGGDKSNTYSAIVSHIDKEGTVWVTLAGNDKETPTASTSSEVARGDVVTVTWRNNKLYIGGNYTNPAAGFYSVLPSIDYVSQLVDKDITVNSITAATGYIDDLYSNHITVEDLQADKAYIETLVANDITAQTISAASGYIADLTAENITAEDIVSDHAAVGSLDANYAKINGANIDTATIRNAWVNQILVQTGLIASEGAVFYLDAIKVNATSITAGTIDVERIVVTDPVTGDKHMVTWDESTHTWVAAKLDGDVIEDLTITADKIVAGAITAEKITTENIVGTGGWINLRLGTFEYVNATSGDGISWDGTTLTINSFAATQAMNTAIDNAAEELTANLPRLDVNYSFAGNGAFCTADVYKNGIPVTSEYADADFRWYLIMEDNNTYPDGKKLLGNGKSKFVDFSGTGTNVTQFGGTVRCELWQKEEVNLLFNKKSGSTFTQYNFKTSGGDQIVATV